MATEHTASSTKRSRTARLVHMIKDNALLVTAGIACCTISGCGSGDDLGYLYSSVDECINAHPGKDEICRSAFAEAETAATESGPRYASESLCEIEFGDGQCQADEGGNYWMPFVAGFIVSEIIDEVGDYFEYKRKRKKKDDRYSYSSSPVFRSIRAGSSGYYGLNEQKFGNRTGKVSVSSTTYNKAPAKVYTASTVRRGGFGSTMGKSYSSSSRSWGG